MPHSTKASSDLPGFSTVAILLPVIDIIGADFITIHSVVHKFSASLCPEETAGCLTFWGIEATVRSVRTQQHGRQVVRWMGLCNMEQNSDVIELVSQSSLQSSVNAKDRQIDSDCFLLSQTLIASPYAV